MVPPIVPGHARTGKHMKKFLILIFAILLAAPAMAEDLALSGVPVPTGGGSSLPAPAVASAKGGRPHARGVVPSKESSLLQALELPPSEFFVLDEPDDGFGEFELNLPEVELPDSDIPLTLNSKVAYFINYFQTRGKGAFARWLSRSERYIPMMKQVLKKEGLPEDLVYLAMIESGFYPHAYSVASAVGPWQFMSATGKRYALRIDPWIDERRDPLKSTVAAAMYLKELYDLFKKDWYLAAAGYNAGENKILRAIDRYNSRDFWELSKGSYLARETKEYVPRLLAAAIIAKEPAKYGFADVAYLPPIEFDTVAIPSRTDLELVATICEVSYQTIRDLNPELRRWCTPPDYQGYVLKIPKGKKSLFETEYAKVPEDKRFTEKIVYTRYRARKRDTVAAVARRFGTTPQVIAELNHLGKVKKLRGKVLLVPVPAVSAEEGAPAKTARAVKGRGDSKGFNKYYTVKRGDTLHALAKRFNVSTRILSAWNNLKGKVALRPGRRLIVAKYVEKGGAMAPADEKG
jgi:membrane-bound lytic murein transglycosylase D